MVLQTDLLCWDPSIIYINLGVIKKRINFSTEKKSSTTFSQKTTQISTKTTTLRNTLTK